MAIIACKFGGTSTANADMLKRINAILHENPDRRYVVLSAPGREGTLGKVTDMLIEARKARSVDAVAERFDAMARALEVDMDFRDELEAALHGPVPTLLSRGEALCAKLFSRYSGIPYVDAKRVVYFDTRGQLDARRTALALKAMARKYPRAVIPGFYGSDPFGGIVTFPRNGSDITGALVAAGVGAALYENWTDVPGLMTGDPARDPGARVIPEISYADMRRLTRGGAQVLHPDCLDPLEAAGIPTRIRCTMDPHLPGTLVQ